MSMFGHKSKRKNDFADHIYPIGLDIKDTTSRFISYTDLHIDFDNELPVKNETLRRKK
jgi:hypothetical protein